MARRLCSPDLMAVGGATAKGARRAAALLIAGGATHLLSFGFAAGLDPDLAPGDLLLPESVLCNDRSFPTDRGLRALLGPGIGGALLHSDVVVTDSIAKQELFRDTYCRTLDMESGAVAVSAHEAGRPFAVLRAICDTADFVLPPAAALPLHGDGTIDTMAMIRSIVSHPKQIPALLRLGRAAGRARSSLMRRCIEIGCDVAVR